MSEYLIRKVHNDFEITKFEDTAEPVAVYSIKSRKCSCPSRYRSCKHISILDSWVNKGSTIGAVLDDAGNILTTLQVA